MTSRLKPGATYIYENADGVIYAREFGASHSERFEIGRTYARNELDVKLEQQKLWEDILRHAKTNPSLQKAVDNVILVYKLIKEDYE